MNNFDIYIDGERQDTFDNKKDAVEQAAYYGDNGQEVEVVQVKTIKKGKIVETENYVEWE